MPFAIYHLNFGLHDIPMKSGNKRADAWYTPLSDTDMWAAYDVCRRMRPWQRGAAWIAETHGLKVSKSAYYRWLDWCNDNALEHTLRDAHRFADETRKVIAETGDIDTTLQQGVAALALDAAAAKDLGSLSQLVRGLGSLRKSELEKVTSERDALKARVSELEAKLASTGDSRTMSPEEKSARLKETFGLR